MSRNAHFRMSPMMANGHFGTAYAPDAAGSAEDPDWRAGMSGLREDDADVRLGISAYDLSGLREDDADVRLGMSEPGGTRWDGATGSAEGSAEGHRDAQMGISAYDLRGAQPGMLRSDGRMGGLVEDHWSVRMGGLTEDHWNVRMGGLREDDADVRLGGLREDDADMRLGVSAYDRMSGLREDDADVRLGISAYDLRGLREDDADLQMGTSYAPDAAGSAEDPDWRSGMGVSAYDRLSGMGVSAYDELGVSAYDRLGISAYDTLGDVDSMSAEAFRIEQEQTLADAEVGRGHGMSVRLIAEDAAKGAWTGAKDGLISSRAEADKFVRSRVEAHISKMRHRYQQKLTRLDEVAGQAIEKSLKRWGPRIDNVLAKRVSVSGIRMGMILRGLREDDANVQLGFNFKKLNPARRMRSMSDEIRKRMRKDSERLRSPRAYARGYGWGNYMRGAEQTPPQLLAAEGFHERFPVTVDIAGMGKISSSVSMAGLFDFLKPAPSAEEYMGKIKLVMDRWNRSKLQLERLTDQQVMAIGNNMVAAKADADRYEGMKNFLAQGYAGYTDGRWERVQRLEAYLPTLETLISQAITLGPAGSPQAEQARVNEGALKNVDERLTAAGSPSFIEKAAPYAAGAVGVAALIGLATALGK